MQPRSSNPESSSRDREILFGGGETGVLMRAIDWDATPLGPVEGWPQSLRSALSICLGSTSQIAIYWGPELIFLYNDAVCGIVRNKHPWALGRPGREVWPELWEKIGPLFAQVLSRGEATRSKDQFLGVHRRGFSEECYFDYTFTPIRDEAGAVGGVFNIAVETTFRVIGERRSRLLNDAGEMTSHARSAGEACTLTATALAPYGADIPFCLVYLIDRDGKGTVSLAASSGLSPGLPASPSVWPIAAALAGGSALLVEDLPGGPWAETCHRALVVPLPSIGPSECAGALVMGISPRLSFDADYQAMMERVAGLLATAIANARANDYQRERADALAELDRAKTAFFSNVSHEFRTPLTLMLGPIEDELAENRLSSESRERLTLAHRNALRLHKLVNTLLDFSRIEAGRAQANYQPTDLSALTAGLAGNFRSAMAKAGLQFVVDCPPLPESVYVDREMWEKIVLNLLSNAFKFTLEGSVTVSLSPLGEGIELVVQDTGAGIPAHELPHLFERFHRVEGARGRAFEGTGIGLALVRELAKLHGGAVAVESALGKGSAFKVFVPLGSDHLPKDRTTFKPILVSTALRPETYVEEAVLSLADSSVPLSRNSPANRARVLIADDSADMRNYLGNLLSHQYEVEMAANGKDAVARAFAHPPDLVLSDVMMPELDGFGVLAALRADPRTSSLPVILLSARAGEEARVEGIARGADDYLTKPFSTRELLARIANHIELARARREASAVLRRNQEALQAALAASGTSTFRWDPINDAFLELDDNFKHLLGLRPDEPLLHSRDVLARVHPGDAPAVAAAIEACARGADFNREFRVTLADGGVRCFYGRARNIPADENHGPYVVGAVTDITKRHLAEEALRQSEERFRTLADNISPFAWMADETGWIFWYNKRWYDFTGTTLEEMEGWGWTKVHHPDHLDHVVLSISEAFRTGNVWEDTFPLRGKDGEYRWFISRARPIRDSEGRIVRWFGTNTDITEQREVEQQLRVANADLQQFAFSASHDLREPLRIVSIYSELLSMRYKDRLDEQGLEFLGYLKTGALRMESLVHDLLAYTQVTSSEEALPEVGVDANRAYRTVIENLAVAIRNSAAAVTADTLPFLRVHSVHIQLLLQNLIENAIKYRSPASPRVHIKAVKDGEHWLFAVQDNGIGIPSEYQERIFGLFKRLHSADEYSGTGIGLSICHRIVERNGGRIWVESEPGKGSTFYFTLPAGATSPE